MADWSPEHIARVRNKAATGDGLGPFWREIVVEALDQLAAAKSSPATGEPVAWRHEIKEPDHDWTTVFSGSSDNPWSHWTDKHKNKCEYRVTPLYSSPPPAMPIRATIPKAEIDHCLDRLLHRPDYSTRTAAAEMIRRLATLSIADAGDGWQLVPVKPIKEMVQAACDATFGPEPTTPEEMHLRGYRAMLAAAPAPSTPEDHGDGWQTERTELRLLLSEALGRLERHHPFNEDNETDLLTRIAKAVQAQGTKFAWLYQKPSRPRRRPYRKRAPAGGETKAPEPGEADEQPDLRHARASPFRAETRRKR